MAVEDVQRILAPARLGPLVLRNRVFVPGHTTNFGHRNAPTERHAAYHAERARGGVGLIITEAVRVHPTSAGRHTSLGSFDDSSIPAYAAVADTVHAEGARIFAQIMHAGRQANGDATRTAAWSASPIPWAAGAHVPHAMGLSDIATVVRAFGAAARRMRQARYDGLEVHAGHGHLLQQFLSPSTNHRTDRYGGTPDNRLRLTREVLAAVSAAAPDLPLGLRVSADEFLPGGPELVAAGEADLVGLARPHIADPHLVRKAMEGRHDETRSCLACNQACIGRVEANLPISCVVNPEVGAEREWSTAWPVLSSDSAARRVLVVGGGPAGLEAALSARRAGHHVTLVEARDHLGGQIRLAARVRGRRRLGLLTEELARDVVAAGVDVRTGVRVTGDEVNAGGYDDVIVATGSTPSRRSLPDGPPVFDVWQAVEELEVPSSPLRGKVVVLDDQGTWAAASIAEHLAVLGAEVHLVSPTASLGARITTYSRLALTRRLGDLAVRAHLMRTVASAGPDVLALTDTLSGHTELLHGVRAVVDVAVPTADDALYRRLDADGPGGTRVHVVGDANAPRTALEATYEGRLAGAFLGSRQKRHAERVAAVY